jgi:dTMP kinase
MLIALEGLDQSGKETQARQLVARLELESHRVQAVSFPDYDTAIGREIRTALSGGRDYPPEVMQLLYVANRFEYKPRLDRWLARGAIVVCDRYRASSVAYGEAQGLDAEWLEVIQRGLPPAWLTLLLDIAPETAAARKAAGRDRYERDLDLLARVRTSYLRQAAQREWVVIDAEQPRDRVAAAVEDAVWSRLSPT